MHSGTCVCACIRVRACVRARACVCVWGGGGGRACVNEAVSINSKMNAAFS